MTQTLNAPVKKKIPQADFDLASVSDVVPLTYLFKEFFSESDYAEKGITYSPNKAASWLRRVIQTGVFPHIIARVDNKIVGVISWSMDDSFCEEPVAVMHTIYVKPDYRRSPIGRILVSLALDIAKNEGACAFSAPISSGMMETKTLQNLFAKIGFKQSGTIFTRAF